MSTAAEENLNGSNLVAHAITELDRIGMTPGDDINGEMRKCILDVIRVVSEQGHSGASASYLQGVLGDLLNFKPLSPLTNDPERNPDGLWQNRRDGECFSRDGGKTFRRNSENLTVLHVADEAVRS